MTTPARKRPWSFTLRTLFVVVTVIACFLGYELNWIRQRHAFLAELPSIRVEVHPKIIARRAYTPVGPTPKTPGFLWLFGEAAVPVMLLVVSENESPESKAIRAKQLFPETQILWTVKSRSLAGK